MKSLEDILPEPENIDAWSLEVLEEEAALTRDWDVIYLAGVVALRLKYGIDVREFDEAI